MAHRVLIIEDEENLCWFLRETFAARGFEASYRLTGEAGLEAVGQERPDVVILDMNLPGIDGLEVLRHIREEYGETLVFILTAYDSADLAVKCLKQGANHYMTKPFDNHELVVRVEQAIDEQLRRGQLEALRTQVLREASVKGIIGRSPAIREVFELIGRIAGNETTTVLITGETGVGKETVAKALHGDSPRKAGPFLAVNCTALPETLLEAELFGHERGAFTGAVAQRRGYFELATGGSLFLDEIGDMSPGAQSKLLRVLQEHKIMRLGGAKDIDVDVRIIAATNRNLDDLLRQGLFRDDLYYRLAVFPIHVPALREREDDVLLLADHFLVQISRKLGRDVHGFSAGARAAMRRAPWPGNVRQLRNAIERGVLLATGPEITAKDLGLEAEDPNPGKNLGTTGAGEPAPVGAADHLAVALVEEWTMDELERRYILALMERHGGHRGTVARILGMDPKTLYRKLKQCGAESGKEE